jgi:hypothetical protein
MGSVTQEDPDLGGLLVCHPEPAGGIDVDVPDPEEFGRPGCIRTAQREERLRIDLGKGRGQVGRPDDSHAGAVRHRGG